MPETHGEEPLFAANEPETAPSLTSNKAAAELEKGPSTEAIAAQGELSNPAFSADAFHSEKNLDVFTSEPKTPDVKNEETSKPDILEQKPAQDSTNKMEPTDANSLLNAIAPHRRSFSGSEAKKNIAASGDQPEAAINKQAKPESGQSFFAKLKTMLLPSPNGPSLNPGYTNPAISSATKNLLTNLPSSWPMLLCVGLIVIFLLIKGFQTFYIASTSLLTHFNNSTAVAPGGGVAISGRWQFAAKWNNNSCQGQIIIHQRDNQIFGQGIDYNFGQYKFTGTRTANHLDLLKQYFVGNSFVGHPIELHGDLDTSSKPLFINGQFKIEFMQGGKWRGRAVAIDGIWEAQMVQPLIEEDSASPNMPLIRKTDERPSSVFADFFGNLSKTGIWFALGIIIFGVGGWHFASSLIGPDGWLGIWDKQKYVPAQFLSEHRKEKRQFANH